MAIPRDKVVYHEGAVRYGDESDVEDEELGYENNRNKKNILKYIPCRLMIGIMIFLSCCNNYMMRVNLNVNLVAMVPFTNETNSSPQHTLDWSIFQRAQVLSSFFWGYLAGSSLSIFIADYLGPRILLVYSTLIVSTLTLFSPLAAKHSYLTLVVLRIIMGLVSGGLFPSFGKLVSTWAVDNERIKFGSASVVGTIGTFVAWITCGPIIERFGWEWGFYFYGIIGMIVTIALYFTVYDTPEQHPRISLNELTYIQQGISDKKPKRKYVPYRHIFTSIPCWSYFMIEFGQGWGIYIIIVVAPHYLASALKYGTTVTSLLSATTYLSKCTSAFIFGHIGDCITKRKLIPTNILRKYGTVLSHITPGLITFCLTIQGFDSSFYVALIIISLAFNGMQVMTCHLNPFDLANNFVGALSSIAVSFSTLAGILLPYVTAYFVQDDEINPESWRPVFYTVSGFYILMAIQFIIFGSTKTQKWNYLEDKNETNESNDNIKS